jgi:hypothetical protein
VPFSASLATWNAVTGWKGATTVVDMQWICKCTSIMQVRTKLVQTTHLNMALSLSAHCPAPSSLQRVVGQINNTISLFVKTHISHLSAPSFLLNKPKQNNFEITRIIPDLFTKLNPVDYTSRVITPVVKTFSNLLNS